MKEPQLASIVSKKYIEKKQRYPLKIKLAEKL